MKPASSANEVGFVAQRSLLHFLGHYGVFFNAILFFSQNLILFIHFLSQQIGKLMIL